MVLEPSRLASMASRDLISSSALSNAALSDFPSVSKAFSFVPTKLDLNNYLYWKAQILTTIRAFDLLPFINKIDLPPKYVPSSDVEVNSELVVNPDFLWWMRSDQLLLG